MALTNEVYLSEQARWIDDERSIQAEQIREEEMMAERFDQENEESELKMESQEAYYTENWRDYKNINNYMITTSFSCEMNTWVYHDRDWGFIKYEEGERNITFDWMQYNLRRTQYNKELWVRQYLDKSWWKPVRWKFWSELEKMYDMHVLQCEKSI